MNSIDKANKVFSEKYGVDSPMVIPDFVRNFVRNKRSEEDLAIEDNICKKLKESSSGKDSQLKDIFKLTLTELEVKFECNVNIGSFEYDFYIPKKNMLLNICPTVTHNNLFSFDEYGKGVPSIQHKAEAENAFNNGYRCIHVFDWDNIFIILNEISSNTESLKEPVVETLNKVLYKSFISQYSMFSAERPGNKLYGLYSNNDLVAVGSFRKSTSKKYSWEMTRYCEDSCVISEDRLKSIINKFISDVNPENIVTYVDLSKYSGKEYENVGFKYIETIYPQRIWSKGIHRILHNSIAGRKYDDIFHTNYGSTHSTYTQMIENGWLPVYDCGKKTYLFEKVNDGCIKAQKQKVEN